MKPLAQYDIFNRLRTLGKKGRPLNERAELVGYFHKHARTKEGKEFPVSFVGMKLAHLKIEDLYYMKSVLESETRRGGVWNKIFWGMLKLPSQ